MEYTSLIISYIFGVLGNILSANQKYSVREYENLLTLPQIQLSSKLKPFPDFLVPFVENTLKFEHLSKKDDRHTYFISEITNCERLG